MDRGEVLTWLNEHPEAVHGRPEEILERCEREVSRQTGEAAWLHARAIAQQRTRDFEEQWGFHASEAFVAREVCHDLAGDLRHLEPHPRPGDEERLLGPSMLAALEPEARERLRPWLHELAEREEHRVWLEIVRFTNARGRELVQQGAMSSELDFEHTHNYAATAARVTRILEEDYAAHARPGRL